MGRQLLSLLDAGAESRESSRISLDDDRLRALYETLTLTRILDRACADLRTAGRTSFFVPALPAAATSAGTALGLESDDWLFPSFRDGAAFLARGGSVADYLAQMLGATGDATKGRQLPGQASLPDGRFVPVSGALGVQIQQAAGVALGMRLRGAASIALAMFGPGAAEQGAFYTGLRSAVRHGAPAVFVCRSRGTESPHLAARAEGFGVPAEVVDGTDCLAVAEAVVAARRAALADHGPRMVEAVVEPSRAENDPANRLRDFVERRGLWDSEQEEAFLGRCAERVDTALEALATAPPPSPRTLLDDVWSEPPWTLQEQSLRLLDDGAEHGDD